MTRFRDDLAAAPARRARHRADPGGPDFRPELQGLRGLAVALVVVYHVWVGRVSGGVDVFLVLSGFLMIGQFARRTGLGVPLDVPRYWLKTAGRIVPPAMVVLGGTVIASVALLPESRWPQTLHEVVASAAFTENWRLAADSVDYYAAKDTASVVQHFWSLSIQAQFYLLFPLVVLAVVLLARRAGRDVAAALAVMLAVVTAASLAYSVWLTAVAQKLAYFDSFTRLWEFTLGGLLALVIDRVAVAPGVRVVLGWSGVLGLISCGLVLDVAGGFPGYLALWPVVCAGLILTAGRTGVPWASDRPLSSRPARYLGDLAFSLYLWHWPVLVLVSTARHSTVLGLTDGLLVIATSLVLAVGTRHLVEIPLRRRRDRGARGSDHGLALPAVAVVALLLLVWQGLLVARTGPAVGFEDPDHPGAGARAPGYVDRARPEAGLLPSPAALSEDWSQPIGPCRPGRSDALLEVCERASVGPPTRRVVVLGDSHSQQLVPALLPTAASRNWELTTMLKGACVFSLGPGVEPSCQEWNTAAVDEITAIHPDVVVVQASRELSSPDAENTPPEYVAAWRVLADRGIRVLAVRDNPRFASSPSACLRGEYGPDAPCSPARRDVVSPVASYVRATDVPASVAFVDLTDLYCTEDACPAAIGNVLVYLDANHVSASYARTMAPAVAAEVDRALGW